MVTVARSTSGSWLLRTALAAACAGLLLSATGWAGERVVRLQSQRLDTQAVVHRVGFGSGWRASGDGHEIWDAVAASGADLFIYAGDTLYPAVENADPALPSLHAAYDELAVNRRFTGVRERMPVLAVWDDHDYGINDGGGDFAAKLSSEALFEDRWALSPRDPRRARDGIYHSVTLGPPGRRMQLILLDTRFFRSPLRRSDRPGEPGAERYLPDPDPRKTLLGAAQWQWLEEQLAQPADLRLLVSSIQVLADGHGWEGWRNLPVEQQRLFELLNQYRETPTLLLSGDRHVAGVYRREVEAGFALLEFTSSPINNTIAQPMRAHALGEAGPFRVGALYGEPNFGMLDIDWGAQVVKLSLRDLAGVEVRRLDWEFSGALSDTSAE